MVSWNSECGARSRCLILKKAIKHQEFRCRFLTVVVFLFLGWRESEQVKGKWQLGCWMKNSKVPTLLIAFLFPKCNSNSTPPGACAGERPSFLGADGRAGRGPGSLPVTRAAKRFDLREDGTGPFLKFYLRLFWAGKLCFASIFTYMSTCLLTWESREHVLCGTRVSDTGLPQKCALWC